MGGCTAAAGPGAACTVWWCAPLPQEFNQFTVVQVEAMTFNSFSIHHNGDKARKAMVSKYAVCMLNVMLVMDHGMHASNQCINCGLQRNTPRVIQAMADRVVCSWLLHCARLGHQALAAHVRPYAGRRSPRRAPSRGYTAAHFEPAQQRHAQACRKGGHNKAAAWGHPMQAISKRLSVLTWHPVPAGSQGLPSPVRIVKPAAPQLNKQTIW